MPKPQWLELALAFHEKLQQELPALVAEVNDLFPDVVHIAMPADGVELDIDPGLITGKKDDFPRIQCGVFTRSPDEELNGDVSLIQYPYVIEVYVAADTKREVFVMGAKWGMVLDQFIERYGSEVYPPYMTEEAPEADMTFCLPNGTGTRLYYSKLVSAEGTFTAYE